MPTQAAVNVPSSGSSPIAVYQQTQNATTVDVQQMVIVDATGTGSASIPAPVDANGLHVVLSNGAQNTSGPISASSIIAGGNATLASSVNVTNGKTGTLQHGIFSSTQPTEWDVQTVNNASSPTTVFSFLTDANQTYDFKPGSVKELSTVLASGSNVIFQVIATNNSTNSNVTATAYATFFWAEN